MEAVSLCAMRGNRALAVFRSGKQYNADLNASYNIGARYFIREITKPLSVKAGVHAFGKSSGSPAQNLMHP